MSDLIDRKAAINAIEQMQLPIMRSEFLHEQFIFQGLSEALAAIKELPPAFQDWQKIILSNLFTRKGKWTYRDGKPATIGKSYSVICSECKEWSEYCTNFCPNCGCRMEEGDSE